MNSGTTGKIYMSDGYITKKIDITDANNLRGVFLEIWIQTILSLDPVQGSHIPKIIKVLKSGFGDDDDDGDGGALYIVMEHIPMKFSAKLRAEAGKGSIPHAQVLAHFKQLAGILYHFDKEYKFRHRDLHTTNIMYDKDKLYLIDFGRSCLEFPDGHGKKLFHEIGLLRNNGGDMVAQYGISKYENKKWRANNPPAPFEGQCFSFDVLTFLTSFCDFFQPFITSDSQTLIVDEIISVPIYNYLKKRVKDKLAKIAKVKERDILIIERLLKTYANKRHNSRYTELLDALTLSREPPPKMYKFHETYPYEIKTWDREMIDLLAEQKPLSVEGFWSGLQSRRN